MNGDILPSATGISVSKTAGALPLGSLSWVEVGEPPASIAAWRAARFKRLAPIIGAIGGVLIGGVGGFAVATIWPGALGWTLTSRFELFLGVALPVGVAEYFTNQWLLAYVANATNLHVRRLAVFNARVYLELSSGGTLDRPLMEARVSHAPIADGWFSVSLPAGRTSLTFYVPGPVAALLTSGVRRP
jgi:hypothetical protein